MGVTNGRVSQIERGKISGQEVLARYAIALGGRLLRPSTSTTKTSPPSRDTGPRPTAPLWLACNYLGHSITP